MAFHCNYTIPGTEREIVACLSTRGLRRSLSRDKSCIFQWAPFSKTNWSRVMSGELMAAAFYVHSGLVRKAELMSVLHNAVVSNFNLNVNNAGSEDLASRNMNNPDPYRAGLADLAARKELASYSSLIDFSELKASLLDFHVITNEDDQLFLKKLMQFFSSVSGVWIIKAPNENNALGVHLIDSDRVTIENLENLFALQKNVKNQKDENPKKFLVQKHIENPLLINKGCKFHLRVNVVAIGCLALYVHNIPVCHIATKKFSTLKSG
eukprot:g3176.t1